MLVFNATQQEQSVKAFGNWFTFKPKQIKEIKDEIAKFIILDKKMYGIVGLPEEMGSLEYRDSEEGKALLIEKTQEGVTNRVNFLKQVVTNAEVGLRQDLEKANIKADFRTYMSKGEKDAMKELVGYQVEEDDLAKKQVEEIKDLEKKLKR